MAGSGLQFIKLNFMVGSHNHENMIYIVPYYFPCSSYSFNFFSTSKRYYGESMPFGKESFDHDKIGYLMIEQAMADFAVLVTELKIQFKATMSKVVAFGGR